MTHCEPIAVNFKSPNKASLQNKAQHRQPRCAQCSCRLNNLTCSVVKWRLCPQFYQEIFLSLHTPLRGHNNTPPPLTTPHFCPRSVTTCHKTSLCHSLAGCQSKRCRSGFISAPKIYHNLSKLLIYKQLRISTQMPPSSHDVIELLLPLWFSSCLDDVRGQRSEGLKRPLEGSNNLWWPPGFVL